MDLLMPIIGCALGIIVSIMSIKVVIDKGKKEIAGAAMNVTQRALSSSTGSTAVMSAGTLAANVARGGVAGGVAGGIAGGIAPSGINTAANGIRYASNSPGLNTPVGNNISIGQTGKAPGVLRGAEALGRTAAGVGMMTTAPISFAAGAAAKATGKLGKFAGRKINGYVRNMGEKKYKAKFGDKEEKALAAKQRDLNKRKADQKLALQKARNNKISADSAYNKVKDSHRYAGDKVALLNAKQMSLEAQRSTKGTSKQKKRKIANAIGDIDKQRDAVLKEHAGDYEKFKNKIDANKAYEDAKDKTKALNMEQAELDKERARLNARHDEFMRRHQNNEMKGLSRTGKALEAVGTGLDTIGSKGMGMGAAGARQVGKAITGKDFFTDKLFAPKGTMQRLAETSAANTNVAAVAIPVTGQKVNNGTDAISEPNQHGDPMARLMRGEYGYNPEMGGMGVQNQFIYNDLTHTTIKGQDGSTSRVAATTESNRMYMGNAASSGNGPLLQIQTNQVGQMQGSNLGRYENAFKEMIGRYNQEMMSQGKEGIPEGTKIAQQAAQQYALMQQTSTDAIREEALNEFGAANKKKEAIEKIAEKSPQVQEEINNRTKELSSKYIPEQSSSEDKKKMEEIIKGQVKERVEAELNDGGSALSQKYGENIKKQIEEQVGKIDLQASMFADGKVEEAKIKEMMEEINKNPNKYANLNAEQIGNSIDQKKMEETLRKMIDTEINKKGGNIAGQGSIGSANGLGNQRDVQGTQQGIQQQVGRTGNNTPQSERKFQTTNGKRLGRNARQANTGNLNRLNSPNTGSQS